ncbi:hypothetical protein ACN20G_01055 [Streptomyces sp. BI20]|uniref:hypothetical protein n=1 Tax=Streptomyces sp. BI20 TaxID=3403460 RepID=UPI003C78C514
MTTTVYRTPLFVTIERSLPATAEIPGPYRPHPGAASLTLRDARTILYDRTRPEEQRDPLWHHVGKLARRPHEDPAGRMAALWIALPGLRRTARNISERFHIAREDVESELLTCFLESARDAPDVPASGHSVLRSACSRAWSLPRRHPGEHSTADVDTTVTCAGVSPEDRWAIELNGRERPDGLAADIRIQVSGEGAEGIRLGALAADWGLVSHVDEARLTRRGRTVGYLSLRQRRGTS